MNSYRLSHEDLDRLLGILRNEGWETIGPTLRDGAVMYDAVRGLADLPTGLRDVHGQGTYHVTQTDAPDLFGYNVGPVSLKRFLFPPETLLFRSSREQGRITLEEPPAEARRIAVIGVRACDVAAANIQDRVFLDGEFRDESYGNRRSGLFVVAVNCTTAGENCFCASMDSGPAAKGHFDLALTEVAGPDGHFFIMQSGGDRGAAAATALGAPLASSDELNAAAAAVDVARQSMGKSLDTRGLKKVLYQSAESSHWEEVAKRCLACANCTMVCPTCFCSTVVDSTDLTGETADRTRVWDSCFNTEYSHMHGGAVRESTSARYRQWLTHKLASWHDQFGTPGCVGCGRCITWCPAGIDLTEEVKGLRVQFERTVP
jgi:sulfhydrogenase subunit beta (sulfur reductase)